MSISCPKCAGPMATRSMKEIGEYGYCAHCGPRFTPPYTIERMEMDKYGSIMKTVDVYVFGETETGSCLICSTKPDGSDKFFLAKKLIIEPRKYKKNEINTFDITDFGWKCHRQLCGDEIFEKEKARRKEWERRT